MVEFNPSHLDCQFEDFIGIYRNAFTQEECESTIALFERCHKLGYTYSRENTTDRNGLETKDLQLGVMPYPELATKPMWELEGDLGFVRSFHERLYDYLYPLYNLKYPIIQIMRRHKSKFLKIQKTEPCEGYHVWHCEHDGGDGCSQRLLAWTLYLNDVEEGGETEFLYQKKRVKPTQGTFLMWPAYFTHTHRGSPPFSGVKYIATGWIEYLSSIQCQGVSKEPDLTSKKGGSSLDYA